MKARTKFQKLVMELSASMPGLTKAQIQEVKDKSTVHHAKVDSSGNCYCYECGHSWKISRKFNGTEVVCPHCLQKLKIDFSRQRVFKEEFYFSVVTTRKGLQVVRTFMLEKKSCKLMPAQYNIFEVFEWWIAPDGKSEVVGLQRTPYFWYSDSWSRYSKFELRSWHSSAYSVGPLYICKNRTILPELKKRGLKGKMFDLEVNPVSMIRFLIAEPVVETLAKSGEDRLLVAAVKDVHAVKSRWPQIKIALRNKYKIENVGQWLDHIRLLEDAGKDIRSPKYLCPQDFAKEHQTLIRKAQERREREQRRLEYERMIADREQMKKDDDAYKKLKKPFFDIMITDGEINIKTLESVDEFIKEGQALHHCVGQCKYYTKERSLIMSARIEDKPVETIEIELPSLKVLQCRGKYNQASPYHNRILELLKDNSNQISKRLHTV